MRVENYHSRVAQACNIILFSCNPHIQQTLANVLSLKECWDKILQAYGNDELIHIQDIWENFVCYRYEGEEITDFYIQYSAPLNYYVVVGIAIQPTIQVLHFVTILDSHFEHQSTNEREQMCRDHEHLPTLDTLVNEITNKALRKRDHVALQLLVSSPKFQCTSEVCSHYYLPHHSVDKCFYKHAHLRRPDWQPNQAIVQCIKSKQKSLHVNMSQPSPDLKSSDLEFDIFSYTYLQSPHAT